MKNGVVPAEPKLIFSLFQIYIDYLLKKELPRKKTILRKERVKTCVCAQSLSRVQLFTTLWTIAHQASLSMRFSRQEYWSGLPFPSPGDLPDPRIESVSLTSPALAAPPGKPIKTHILFSNNISVFGMNGELVSEHLSLFSDPDSLDSGQLLRAVWQHISVCNVRSLRLCNFRKQGWKLEIHLNSVKSSTDP